MYRAYGRYIIIFHDSYGKGTTFRYICRRKSEERESP